MSKLYYENGDPKPFDVVLDEISISADRLNYIKALVDHNHNANGGPVASNLCIYLRKLIPKIQIWSDLSSEEQRQFSQLLAWVAHYDYSGVFEKLNQISFFTGGMVEAQNQYQRLSQLYMRKEQYHKTAKALEEIPSDLESFLFFAEKQHGHKKALSELKIKKGFNSRMKFVLSMVLHDSDLGPYINNQIIELALDLNKPVKITIDLIDNGSLDPKVNEQIQASAVPKVLKLRALVLAYTIAYKANKFIANESDILSKGSPSSQLRLFGPEYRNYFKNIKPGLIKSIAERLLASNAKGSVNEICQNQGGVNLSYLEAQVKWDVKQQVEVEMRTYADLSKSLKANNMKSLI